jgi:pyridoxamine 5'-phosphate oxidase family protein
MATFTPAQLAYLRGQLLGRLATAGSDGHPHVVPVSFAYNAESGTIDIGGLRTPETKKYRDVQANPWAALVVDDQVSVDPWVVRMLEIRGPAEALASGGAALRAGFADEIIRLHPARIVSFGLDNGAAAAP